MLRAVTMLGSILTVGALVESFTPPVRDAKPQIRLVGTKRLPGSFVVAQAVYADHERVFLGSYQGDLLFCGVIERQTSRCWKRFTSAPH